KNSNLIVCPINCRSAIENLLKSTKKSADIEIEDINDQNVVSDIIKISKVAKVRLIAPPIEKISSNENSLRTLKSAGVSVRFLSSPYIHAKLILSDTKRAYVGSVNLSTQSMDRNRELGIIISQTQALQKLSQTFNSDWQS